MDWVIGIGAGIAGLALLSCMLAPLFMKDPSSWTMDPKALAEYDRLAEESHKAGRS